MTITKFGHSCLLVEEGSARILLDPGMWSEGHTGLENIDAIFITHEHQDHCDTASIRAILGKNSGVKIYTNSGVGKKLAEAGISYELCENGQTVQIVGVSVVGVGTDHAEIYSTLPIVKNTGYFIANRFFYPGDTVSTVPMEQVEILALPVVAPWMRMADCLDYLKRVHPAVCFPVHDGMLKYPGPYHSLPQKTAEDASVFWQVLEPGAAVLF